MNGQYKYIIFSPYFGKLPSHFNLWLKSCSYNKNFKFIVFTDDEAIYDTPANVEIQHITFNCFKEKVQERFEFKIALNDPYKLCDYKPTWGYVFYDYLKDCDYWGHCDLDLIFGRIDHFLPKKSYDKISYLGHFCLYKNTRLVREAFFNTTDSSLNYLDILSHEQHFGFDEISSYGINHIFEEKGLSVYNLSPAVADITSKRRQFFISRYENGSFKWSTGEKAFVFDEGTILSIDLNMGKVDGEYSYVHFQKRNLQNTVCNPKKFIITCNGFFDYEPIDKIRNLSEPGYKSYTRLISLRIASASKKLSRKVIVRRIKKRKKGE